MLKQWISPGKALVASLWLLGAALFAGHALTSPTSQCRTQAEVTLPVSPPPPKKAAPGFDVIELLVPNDVSVTGSVK